MSASLVGSEMCIRDSKFLEYLGREPGVSTKVFFEEFPPPASRARGRKTCLLYTSDAADDM
eukprot:2082116-Alexandrium_andersonii.AAC.1